MDPTAAARSGRARHQHPAGRVRLPGQHDDRTGRGPEPTVGHPVRRPDHPRDPRHPAGDRAVASRNPRGVVSAGQLDPDPRQRAAGSVRLHVHRRLPETRHAGRWLRPAHDGQVPAVRARGRAHDRPHLRRDGGAEPAVGHPPHRADGALDPPDPALHRAVLHRDRPRLHLVDHVDPGPRQRTDSRLGRPAGWAASIAGSTASMRMGCC